MTASDLETVYTALLARLPDAAQAMVLIEQAQRLTHDHPLRDAAAQADGATTPPAP